MLDVAPSEFSVAKQKGCDLKDGRFYSAARFVAYLRGRRTDLSDEIEYKKKLAQANKLKLEARKYELNITRMERQEKEEIGELLRRSDVISAIQHCNKTVRDALFALVDRLSAECENQTAPEIRKRVRKALNDAFAGLSDPCAYEIDEADRKGIN